MSQLAELHRQLNRLRRRRAVVRKGSALAIGLTGSLLLMGLVYLCDWSLRLPWQGRMGLVAGWALLSFYVARRWSWPLWRERESLADAAVWVEHRHRVDSDLIAALQFDGDHNRVGSQRLSGAVVESVAEYAKTLNVFDGFRWSPLPKKLLLLAVTLAFAALIVGLSPAHALAFWQRLWQSDARYPTRTQIVQVEINGHSVTPHSSAPQEVAMVAGQPLELNVATDGRRPRRVWALLTRSEGATAPHLELKAKPAHDAVLSWSGQLAHVTEPVSLVVHAGDADADPIRIRLLALPVVTVKWSATPPAYAAGNEAAAADIGAGARNLTVLTGSELSLTVRCENKDLQNATLTLDGRSIPLLPADGQSRIWSAPAGAIPTAGQATLPYSITAKDVDGLELPAPVTGQIRWKADRPPKVAAAVLSKVILPTGQPQISCGATDDFGLHSISASVTIKREAGAASQHLVSLATIPIQQPPTLTLRETYPLDLSPYNLQKGDEVQIRIAARDWRGDLPGEVGVSDPVTLAVTDRSGILASLMESDEQSARQLDAIIRRDLGIGGEP